MPQIQRMDSYRGAPVIMDHNHKEVVTSALLDEDGEAHDVAIALASGCRGCHDLLEGARARIVQINDRRREFLDTDEVSPPSRRPLPSEEALNGEIQPAASIEEALRAGEERLKAELKELRRRLPDGDGRRIYINV